MRHPLVLFLLVVACGSRVRLGDATDPLVPVEGAPDAASPTATDEGGTGSVGEGGADAASDDASDGNVCAIDTPTSCGRCGHDCRGGACVNGLCTPVAIATELAPVWLAADATHVFFGSTGHPGTPGDRNALTAVLKDGSNATPLRVDQGTYAGLAFDGTFLFSARNTSTVVLLERLLPDGTQRTTTGVALNKVGGAIAVDGTDLYLAATTTVEHIAKATVGGGTTTLATGFTAASGLAQEGSVLYVGDANALAAVSKADGSRAWTASGVGNVVDVTYNGNHVYFAGTDRVGRLAKTGTNLEIFASGLTGATGVALDGADVYWLTSDSVVASTTAAPTTFAPVATGLSGLGRLVLDDTFLYFTDTVGNTVYRLAR